MTISDLLDELGDPHPYAVVRINDNYVSRPNFDNTTIPDDAKVFLIPMMKSEDEKQKLPMNLVIPMIAGG